MITHTLHESQQAHVLYIQKQELAFDFKGDIRRDGRIALMQISTLDRRVLMVDCVRAFFKRSEVTTNLR
jgi:hypothetical protein